MVKTSDLSQLRQSTLICGFLKVYVVNGAEKIMTLLSISENTKY